MSRLTAESGIGGSVNSIVCMKICVDTNQLKVMPETHAPDIKGAPLRISTFDENAIEEAVRIKEAQGGRVVGITLVPFPPPREIVLKALAMGLDSVYIIRDESCADAEPLITARILSTAIRKIGAYDLIMCGEASIDQFNGQVGPRIAAELGLSALTYVTRLTIKEGTVLAERALEDYVEAVEAPYPVLVTVGGEINQPRLPPVLQIMSASRKPTVEWRLEDLDIVPADVARDMALSRNVEVYAPPSQRKRVTIEGETVEEAAERLVRILSQEGVVKI